MPDPVMFRVGQIWERDGVQRIILRLFLNNRAVDCVMRGEIYRIDWIRVGARYPVYGRAASWEVWSEHASLVGLWP